ncbi:Putative two-component membrane permease complex subunit SMU_747c [Neobacillus rhizosphaerae]|uniref:Two-component membrane permease complex subunit SMU_747c n=1 Tax=Neobacillus rhizosphaerae TaxID=2880965 RepID=A0ABM9ELY8_9BACI|nr:permease [Neobacillus rhizosphaerae]CAH2713616.1 Putative two-component membrane permease complex subunit SMU_747c [Neobacillus rhizosphaerae]
MFGISLPQSFLQMNTIFISILIEALPFVTLGVLISGIIQIFVTEEMIAKIMPKNPILAVIFASFLGILFPSCECGIVPIVSRLVSKGVPISAGIAFMLTAPIINPVVLFATYIAFGSDWKMPLYRALGAIVVALAVGILIAYRYKGNPFKENHHHDHHHHEKTTVWKKVKQTLEHAVEEFFSMGKYLIIGSLIAAAVQTYIKTATLVSIGHGPASSSIVMMALSFILSLCSEADAFIASSFRTTFSTGSLLAFLVFGPMVDIKNLMMMLATFKKRLVFMIVASVFAVVFVYSLLF